jgi:hypothetical protein
MAWCCMTTNSYASSTMHFLEGELNFCHMCLDVAGPKPTANALTTVRQGYDTVCCCLATVRDAAALTTINSKLIRLRERLLRYSIAGSHDLGDRGKVGSVRNALAR